MILTARRIAAFLLFTSLAFAGSEPYRVRMTSSAAKARLVGVANTPTAGDTVAGTYTYTLMMHDFPVEHTGNYLLQEDPLGGTTYATRTDWSDATGKFVLGRDAVTGIYGDANSKYFNGIVPLFAVPTETYPTVNIYGTGENVRDTTLYLHGDMTVNFSQGYKVDWKNNNFVHKLSSGVREFGKVLFYSSLDTNVTVNGGEFYGHADNNYIDDQVTGLVADSSKIYVEGLSVEADSLVKWYIHILSGTGSGQTRRIESNVATGGGSTLITLSAKWTTPPDATSTYRLTSMDEYQSGLDINKSKDVKLLNLYIHDFPGDGIAVSGSENVLIENCVIQNPLRWFYTGGSGNYQDLVGRQGITLGGGTTGTWHDQPDTTAIITGMDTLRNVRITKCKIRGGYPGGIDLEPLGRCYIENLEISECEVETTPGQGGSGIIIYVGDSTVVKNLTIRNNLIKSDGCGIWLQNNGTHSYWYNVNIVDNVIIPHTYGTNATGVYILGDNYYKLRFTGNYIAGWGSRGVEITASTFDMDYSNNRFYDNGNSNFYASGSKRVKFNSNLFKDNAPAADSSGDQMYISGVTQLVAQNNIFICSEDSTIQHGLNLYNCDSVLVKNNISYGHGSDEIGYYALTNYVISDNSVGFGQAGSVDSLVADTRYDFGNSEKGDSTVALYNETKRVELRMYSYRDVGDGFVGSKIVGQSTANPGYGESWRVQNGHILFYTLNSFPNIKDQTRLRALITGNGLGLADSSYINFFPKNSASNTDPDTLWRYVGESGYGLRDSSGNVQYKHSGGDWANVGSAAPGGSGDVSGPASSTDEAIAVFNGTDGKTIKNSLATISAGGELSSPIVYARPSTTLGFLVSREATLAGTDSCANLGVTNGAGTLNLYSGNGHTSLITVNNSDVMLFNNATYYAFRGPATNGIYVSGEAVFAAADSFAALQVSGGCGQLYLVSSDGLPEYGTITMAANNRMEFRNAGKYDFDYEINTYGGANPITDAGGDIAIDTDDSMIEFHDGTASRVIPALQSRTFTILEPDIARTKTDDIILMHVMADAFPFGITIKDIALSSSAACSDTHVIEEWSNRAGAAQATIESIALAASQYQEDDGTLSDAAIAADAFISINLDDSTDDIASLEITITFWVNEGD